MLDNLTISIIDWCSTMEVNLSIHPVEYHGHLWSTTKPNLRTAEVSFPPNFEPLAKSDNGIKISMDGKGRAEHIYLNPANGGKELYDGVHEYMNFYNFERIDPACYVIDKDLFIDVFDAISVFPDVGKPLIFYFSTVGSVIDANLWSGRIEKPSVRI